MKHGQTNIKLKFIQHLPENDHVLSLINEVIYVVYVNKEGENMYTL